MPSRPDSAAWDLGPVFDLINNLSCHDVQRRGEAPLANANFSSNSMLKEKHEGPSTLGNFSRVWEFLGVPPDLPPPVVPPVIDKKIPEKDAYNSDGAIYCAPSNKGVRWQDELDRAQLRAEENQSSPERSLKPTQSLATNGSSDYPNSASDVEGVTSTPLTKKQRKRENRRARRDAEAAQRRTAIKAASDFESEDESKRSKKAPAKKASEHIVAPESPTPKSPLYNLRSRKKAPTTPIPQDLGEIATPSKTKILKILPPKISKTSQHATPVSNPKFSAPLPLQFQTPPVSSNQYWEPLSAPVNPLQLQLQNAAFQPLQTPQGALPSPRMSIPQGFFSPQPSLQQPFQPLQCVSRQSVHPLTVRHGEDRHWHFLLKLIHDFGEDKKWLVSPMQLSNNRTSPEGIHVFVDASNILIGFHDTLKRLQGLPPKARIPQANISFDSLVLLMERRRPVAKRVLVGSSPLLPAFEMAKAVGYETNILDKVYKAKELTDRQKFFQQFDKNRWQQKRRGRSGSGGEANGNSSGSETIAAAGKASVVPEKWVEQGVDEILHLKILESVVDADRPSTIVLATGDAAEAEYSQGFMAMVERALKKGWNVELISWSKNISFAYRKKAFQARWAGRFRIIELDDYAEDLLDT